MSLYWPADKKAIVAKGRMHALVVGVGDYRHLGLGAKKPSLVLPELRPLTTTPLAAKRFARWCESSYHNPNCPLGSIELLLAPTEKVDRADGTTALIEAATFAKIKAAFNRWYKRCNADPANIAMFYIAGHGLELFSHLVLASDFGNPDLPDAWENCVDFTALRTGMRKCAADTQLFFVDTCRDVPISAVTQLQAHGSGLVTSQLDATVETSAAYFASAPGLAAYGPAGSETYFCSALMMCLDGVAAARSGPKWEIDTGSLGAAMFRVMRSLSAFEDRKLSVASDAAQGATVTFPAEPKVLLSVLIDPTALGAQAAITVTQGADVFASPSGERRPWMRAVRPELTQVDVSFPNVPPLSFADTLAPPTYTFQVPV